MSQTAKVLSTLQSGKELTAKQIKGQYSLKNPYRAIHYLREQGYPVYLNRRTDSRGRMTNKYRLGKATRAVVSAGLRATA